MNETPAPSRRRGRPPKDTVLTISALAPPQESVPIAQVVHDPGQSLKALAVPSTLPAEPPLEPVIADDVDLRENPVMAAKHSVQESTAEGTLLALKEIMRLLPDDPKLSGSDSKVRGASDSNLPVEVGTPGLANPTLPEQFHGATGTSVEADEQRHLSPAHQVLVTQEARPVEPSPSWTPVQVSDVVQISSHRNKLYGTLFIVGDIKNNRVHGYQIGPGGKLEYFTVGEDECVLVGPMVIGSGQVRSRNGCSAKWKAEQR